MFVPQAASMSSAREQLIRKALAALSEVADSCGERPAARSLMLRFVLAYTFVEAGADPKMKWIWDDFWQHATASPNSERTHDAYMRATGARTALNGICLETGYEPCVTFLEYLARSRESGTSETGVVAAPGSDPGAGERPN
jgi:hypothetical protein